MKYEIDDDGNIRLKAILIGDSGVGKTNLINISAGKEFDINEKVSVNASFFRKQFDIDGKTYNIYLWDTIGQEKLRSLTKLFFKNSKIVVLVFDITNKQSFLNLELWLKDVKEALGDDFVIGVCGNKTDLYLKEQVNEEECIKYAESINGRWLFTSAKTDKVGFPNFLKELVKDYMQYDPKGNIGNKKKSDNNNINKNNDKNIVLKGKEHKGKKNKKKFCFLFS